jgi:hypothetical protein
MEQIGIHCDAIFQIEKVFESEPEFELFVLYSYPIRFVFVFEYELKCGNPNQISSVSDPNTSITLAGLVELGGVELPGSPSLVPGRWPHSLNTWRFLKRKKKEKNFSYSVADQA